MVQKKRVFYDDDDDDDDDEAPEPKKQRSAVPSKKRRKNDWGGDDSDDDDAADEDEDEAAEDEDDEEGGVAEDAPAAEEEEEAEDSGHETDEFDDEGYKGAADYAELQQMTAVQREQTLADRFDRKERRAEVLKIREQTRAMKAASAPKPRRGASRGADAKAKSQKQGMKELAEQRRGGAAKQREREAELARRDEEARARAEKKEKPKKKGMEAGEWDEEEMDDDRSRGAFARPKAQVAPPMGAAEEGEEVAAPDTLERIRLKRSKMERWLKEPYFERALVGSFVRINIGNRDGNPVYRVAQIVGVKGGFRRYMLGAKETDVRVELQVGGAKKYFEMGFVSNQDFNEEELSRYMRVLREESLAPPSRKHVEAKYKDLKQCASYAYNEEEVNAKIAENQEAGRLGNLAHLRHNIERQIAQQETLIARGGFPLEKPVKQPDGSTKIEVTTLEQAQEKLAQLKRTQAASQVQEKEKKELDDKRATRTFQIADINNRNAVYQHSVADVVGARKLQEERDLSTGAKVSADPFARLPTRPVNYWLVGSDVKKEEPKKEEPKEEEPKAAAPGLAVDVDAATGAGAAPLVSPGFKELLETPRAADGADGGATSSPLAGFKGSTPRDGGAKGAAVPSGRRAAAHAEGVDGDIEIDIGESAAAPPPPKPQAKPAPASGGGASGGKRLSLGDYKRRTSGA